PSPARLAPPSTPAGTRWGRWTAPPATARAGTRSSSAAGTSRSTRAASATRATARVSPPSPPSPSVRSRRSSTHRSHKRSLREQEKAMTITRSPGNAAPELATVNLAAELVEKVVVDGDLSKLSPAERLAYYRAVCDSVGLNPLTKPFEYIHLNGKLRLYALKGATDQLRSVHGISIELEPPIFQDDLVIVTAVAKDRNGRVDSDTGAVPIAGLKGEAKANAILKAITKAKRRVTLSMV